MIIFMGCSVSSEQRKSEYWKPNSLSQPTNCISRNENQLKDLGLKEAGDAEVADARNISGDIFELLREFFVHAARGFVDRGENQILQHFLIFSGENFGFDLNFGELLLAVHFHGDHAAAGGGFHANFSALVLETF